MSYDITYRPLNYDDVLGQEATIAILKQYVVQGKGFYQSYLFCGGHGSGKTTLGRILARALLCEAPVEGAPCNKCVSCRSLLEGGTSIDFQEVDAATKSGKKDIDRIKEEIQYATISGKRRIYLFDECFTEETLLLTRCGFRSIRDLVESRFNGEVLSFDMDEGVPIWVLVADWFDLGDREVVTVTFDNDVELTVTTNQKFYTTNRGWVGVLDLSPDDDVEETRFSAASLVSRWNP